jgi:hypothetical protein
MTAEDMFKAAIKSIDWNQHVNTFVQAAAAVTRVAQASRRLALWSKALLSLEPENPARTFLIEMQVEGHYVAALIPLALYKPAAGSMRAAFESALCFSYFRTHLTELATITRDADYFAGKGDIISYHKLHTPGFKEKQEALGLITAINRWYSNISAVVHGQVPGTWVSHVDLATLKPKADTTEAAIMEFETGVSLINLFLLSVIDTDRWGGLQKEFRQEILKGLPGKSKQILGLSIA